MQEQHQAPLETQHPKNLVMGYALGLTLDDLQLFCVSLRRVCPDAHVVLFVKDVDTAVQRMANEYGIQLLPLVSCYYGLRHHGTGKKRLKQVRSYFGLLLVKFLTALERPVLRLGFTSEEYRELSREIRKLIIHTSSTRFVQFFDFLRLRQFTYGKVLLTDVRDVFFQSDPFQATPADQLLFFQEEPPHTVGNNQRNRRWVEATFGKRVLKQIAHQPCICSGVTLGGFSNIFGFLRVLEPEFLRRTPLYIADQGIYNAMAYTGAANHLNPRFVKNGLGPVLTVGLMKPETVRLNDRSLVVDPLGVPYPIVHQYDRHPHLLPGFRKLAGVG